jgi:hypothetical protein
MIKTRIENGILISEYENGMHLDLVEAKQLVADRLKLQAGKSYPVVIHLNNVKSNSKAVRTYMAKEGTEGISHGAFIVKNFYEKVFINFFLLVDAPKVPSRVFQTEEEAIKWLQAEIKGTAQQNP